MDTQRDFEELLALFVQHAVEFLIVGGYALAFHGRPRFTGDLDLWVRCDHANATNILAALNSFGFSSLDLRSDDLTTPNQIVQLGVSPLRVDLLTSITGVEWGEAATRSVHGAYGGVPVRFIGVDDFIRNKRAVGRAQDLADIEAVSGGSASETDG